MKTEQEVDERVGTNNESRQIVTFSLGAEEYGIDIAHVQEINRMLTVTHVPRAERSMDGVVNLRGQLIPVVDLRTRFAMPRAPRTRASRIIVIESPPRRIGIVVDSVSEVVRIPLNQIEQTPEVVTVAHAGFLAGVGKLKDRLIILLDVSRLVSGQAE